MVKSERKGVSRIGERHRISRRTTTNSLDRSWVLRCRCTRANIRCEVELPISMPTVVSSTFSAFQIASASARRAASDHSWKCGSSPSWVRCSARIDSYQNTRTAAAPASAPMDMRTWIDQLERAGELIRIDKPVDPLTQMGSLLYQSREKALLFESLPHGWRSLGQAPANVRHAALAFGATEQTVVPLVAAKLGARIPPTLVPAGRVKEVKLAKGEFDLTQLPVHVAGQRDGGPVIGSG